MTLITGNLYLLLLLGLVLFLGSFLRLGLVRPHRPTFNAGIGLLLLTAMGAAIVLFSPPGQLNTVIEQRPDKRPQPPVTTAVERLQLPWDSEGLADWPAADTLAELSDIAYEPPYLAEKAFGRLGFGKVMPIVQGSMIGYVISADNATVVVFRGTDFSELSDWLANVGRSAITTEHGPVHRGFYNAYQSMKGQVMAILNERKPANLWVTGHSLGGALALFCAYDLVEVEKRQLNGIMTFGQPMVARKQFADHIDQILVERYAAFVNADDAVPKVPPSHVACGSLVWFTKNGVRRTFVRRGLYAAASGDDRKAGGVAAIEMEQPELRAMSEEEFTAWQQKLRQENAAKNRLPDGTPMNYEAASAWVDDHSMSLYLAKIRELLGLDSIR